MKTETEIQEMIEVFKAEIEKNAKRPQFNRAEREAVAEIRERYLGKIAVLEWVLEPGNSPEAISPQGSASDPLNNAPKLTAGESKNGNNNPENR